MQEFSIWKGIEKVGTAWIEKQGMCYVIRCKCYGTENNGKVVWVKTGEKLIFLGKCVPEGRFGTIIKRITCRSLDIGKLKFMIEQNNNSVELSDVKPFLQISRLPNACCVIRNGSHIIYFTD